MKKAILSTLMLIMAFAPGMILASQAQQQSIDKLMALSGLNKQIAELPAVVKLGLEQARQKNPTIQDAEKEVFQAMEKAFQPSEVLSVIAMDIKNSFSEQEVQNLLSWYESDLGRKITKAEEEASTAAAYQAMDRQSQTLLADAKRVNYAKKMVNLTNATELAMEIQEGTLEAVFTAVSLAMKPNQPVDMDAFKARMLLQQEKIRASIEQSNILSMVFTYKAIDDASLAKYMQFLEKPETKKLTVSAIKGIKHAFNQATAKMAESLVAALKKTKN